MSHATPFAPAQRPAAFTLVELVLSLAIMSILLGGLASTILVASHALPDDNAPARLTARADDALAWLAADLSTATTFLGRDSRNAVFTVPDRNNDGLPETIIYTWNGTPGQPLRRIYNSGALETVVPAVDEFAFDWITRRPSDPTAGSVDPRPGEETVVGQFNSFATVSTVFYYYQLAITKWAAVNIIPTPPAKATKLRITRVQFSARKGSGSGTLYISAQTSKSGTQPSGTMIGSVASLSVSSLASSFSPVSVTLSNAEMSPPDSFWIVIASNALSGPDLYAAASAIGESNSTTARTTATLGASWDPPTSEWHKYEVPITVYGEYDVDDPGSNREFVAGARVALRISGAADSVTTTIPTINYPEITP